MDNPPSQPEKTSRIGFELWIHIRDCLSAALPATNVWLGSVEQRLQLFCWLPLRYQNSQQIKGKQQQGYQLVWCLRCIPFGIHFVLPRTANSIQTPRNGKRNQHPLTISLSTRLSAQPFAAFGTAAPENVTTGFGGHPLAEAVPVGPFYITWLKCPFHGTLLLGGFCFSGTN